MKIPKASQLFSGDINKCVVEIQRITGVEITPSWWTEKVDNNGTTKEILERFDRAYARDFGDQINAKH